MQTGTKVFKMKKEDLKENPIASYGIYFLENTNLELDIRAKKLLVAITLNKTTWKGIAQKSNILYDNNGLKFKIGKTNGEKTQ